MADNKKKKKSVCYRRCVADRPSTADSSEKFDLQDLLDKASKKIKAPWMRPIGTGGTQYQFLAYLLRKQGCLCGTLVLCESDKMIPLIDHDPQSGSTWEGEIAPVDAKGTKRKLEEQALFFVVRENHVAVLQTKELSISDLQDFLTWFIQSRAELVTGWMFDLQNLPSSTALAKLKDHKIKAVKFGKQAFWPEKTVVPGTEGAKRKRYTKSIKSDPIVLAWLRQLTENNSLIDELERSDDPGSIFVELEISYRSRSEKDARSLMTAVAATMGGHPDFSPEIELDGKDKIKGDELTIRGDVEVQCPNGNISKDDAMTRLAEWLKEAIKTKKVLV